VPSTLDGTTFGVSVNNGILKEGGVNASFGDLVVLLATIFSGLYLRDLYPTFPSIAVAKRKGKKIIAQCNITELVDW